MPRTITRVTDPYPPGPAISYEPLPGYIWVPPVGRMRGFWKRPTPPAASALPPDTYYVVDAFDPGYYAEDLPVLGPAPAPMRDDDWSFLSRPFLRRF